jgi:hypothetical protein
LESSIPEIAVFLSSPQIGTDFRACFLVEFRAFPPKTQAHFQDHILTMHTDHMIASKTPRDSDVLNEERLTLIFIPNCVWQLVAFMGGSDTLKAPLKPARSYPSSTRSGR